MEGSLKAEYPEEAMLQQIITITARQRRKIEELWMCEEGNQKKRLLRVASHEEQKTPLLLNYHIFWRFLNERAGRPIRVAKKMRIGSIKQRQVFAVGKKC